MVFVKVVTTDQGGKLVRVHGVVREIEGEDDEQEFELCALRFGPHDADRLSDHCVDVTVLSDTSIFDSNADPTTCATLQVGDEVTVMGRLRPDDDANDDDGLSQSDQDDDDDDDAANDDRLSDTLNDVHLDAFVIDIGPRGTFTNLHGIAASKPASAMATFDFAVTPAQGGIPDKTVLAVQLQEQTKIFSKESEQLDFSAIEPDLTAMVDGILLLSNTIPDGIKSTVVVLDVLSEQLGKLSGEIVGEIDADNRQFLVETAEDGEACVVVPPTARIVRVDSSDDGLSSDLVDFDALATGQTLTCSDRRRREAVSLPTRS